MVTGLDVRDALADRLDDSSTLVSENDWERAFGVLAGECVGIFSPVRFVSASDLLCPPSNVHESAVPPRQFRRLRLL